MELRGIYACVLHGGPWLMIFIEERVKLMRLFVLPKNTEFEKIKKYLVYIVTHN